MAEEDLTGSHVLARMEMKASAINKSADESSLKYSVDTVKSKFSGLSGMNHFRLDQQYYQNAQHA